MTQQKWEENLKEFVEAKTAYEKAEKRLNKIQDTINTELELTRSKLHKMFIAVGSYNIYGIKDGIARFVSQGSAYEWHDELLIPISKLGSLTYEDLATEYDKGKVDLII
jgi:hypothetical protein